jgi:glycerophosphoryl diester phosphodiesterase
MRILAIAAAGLTAVWGVAAGAVELQGHRGARGLAPENTVAAFALALGLGVDVLELDTGVTKDGRVVVSHDPYLNPEITRGPDGQWLPDKGVVIAALDYATLRRFELGRIKPGTRYAQTFAEQQPKDGERLPLLSDVFALAAKAGNAKVGFNIETKIDPRQPALTVAPEPFAEAVIAEIRKHGVAARSTLQSFDWRTLVHAQKVAPEIATVYLSAQQSWLDNIGVGKAEASPWTAGFNVAEVGGSVPRLVVKAGGRIWSPYFADLTPAAQAEAKALGLRVVVWTVNRPEDMAALIDRKVDGIITDRPDLLRKVMADKGIPLPAPTPVPGG